MCTHAGAPGVLLERVRQLDAIDEAVVKETGILLVNRHEEPMSFVGNSELSVGLKRDQVRHALWGTTKGVS
jgi:hypothetical protein